MRGQGCTHHRSAEEHPAQVLTWSHANGGLIVYLLCKQRLDNLVCLFLPSVVDEGNANGKAANDLLVLRLVRVLKHFVGEPLTTAPEHNETHANTGCLARNSRVHVERRLEVLECT